MTDADKDGPWPLNGYAPGNYMCHCRTCGKQFEGDKRATTCLECAVRAAKSSPASVPVASEPVAWQWRYSYDQCSWSEWGSRRDDASELLASGVILGEQSRPLYASPQPTFNDGVEAALMRLREVWAIHERLCDIWAADKPDTEMEAAMRAYLAELKWDGADTVSPDYAGAYVEARVIDALRDFLRALKDDR